MAGFVTVHHFNNPDKRSFHQLSAIFLELLNGRQVYCGLRVSTSYPCLAFFVFGYFALLFAAGMLLLVLQILTSAQTT